MNGGQAGFLTPRLGCRPGGRRQPVLSKLPKNFFDVATGDGKWVERKEVLEVLANATNGKRLQPDDYLEATLG